MAKRKKHTKKSSTHHRRRVSGIGDNLQMIGLAALGGIAANKITAMLKKQTGTMATIAPYVGLIGAIALPMLVKKSAAVKDIAVGMGVSGTMEVLKIVAPNLIGTPYSLPVVSGRNRRVNGGVFSPNSIAGYVPNNSTVNPSLAVVSGMMQPKFTGAQSGM